MAENLFSSFTALGVTGRRLSLSPVHPGYGSKLNRIM